MLNTVPFCMHSCSKKTKQCCCSDSFQLACETKLEIDKSFSCKFELQIQFPVINIPSQFRHLATGKRNHMQELGAEEAELKALKGKQSENWRQKQSDKQLKEQGRSVTDKQRLQLKEAVGGLSSVNNTSEQDVRKWLVYIHMGQWGNEEQVCRQADRLWLAREGNRANSCGFSHYHIFFLQISPQGTSCLLTPATALPFGWELCDLNVFALD